MDINYLFLGICVVLYLIGLVLTICQVYRFTVIDAKIRGMKHPKAMGLLASSGQGGGGMLLYLIKRKQYPVSSVSMTQKKALKQSKTAACIGVCIMLFSIALVIVGLNLMF